MKSTRDISSSYPSHPEVEIILDSIGRSELDLRSTNLEKLVAKYGEIAARGHHIIEQRKKEIEQVRIPIEGNEVDLRELWLTAHGYRILSALEYRLTTNLDGFESVKSAFKEVDLTLNSGTPAASSTAMSDDMKNSIWWIAENRGIEWRRINSNYEKKHPLIIVTESSDAESTDHSLTKTSETSLLDTVRDNSIPIVLREPALIELARRKNPNVITFCDTLLHSEDRESWFSALIALETLNTYDAAQRLLVLSGTASAIDRKMILSVLARVLTSSHREGFRRVLRTIPLIGVLNVTDWTPTALRVLESVCAEKGVQIADSAGRPLSNL